PTGVLLALNVRFTGLPLGMERVEVLLQTLLGGLARVDRAADALCACAAAVLPGSAHTSVDTRFGRVSPKNRGPDQRAPVISRAITDSDRQRWPRHSKPFSTTVIV